MAEGDPKTAELDPWDIDFHTVMVGSPWEYFSAKVSTLQTASHQEQMKKSGETRSITAKHANMLCKENKNSF